MTNRFKLGAVVVWVSGPKADTVTRWFVIRGLVLALVKVLCGAKIEREVTVTMTAGEAS